MATNSPSKRYRKLPRNILNWMISAIAIAMIVMVAYRYRTNPTNEREAKSDEKEKKEVVSQRPGDAAAMKSLLEKAVDKARADKAKEEREAKKSSAPMTSGASERPADATRTAADSVPGYPSVPAWTAVPGRMPGGVPVEQYEAAKLQAQKAAQTGQAQTASQRIVAFEFDQSDGADRSRSSSGNSQVDALLDQLKAAQAQAGAIAGAATANGGMDIAAIQRLIAQAQGNAPGNSKQSSEEWLKKAAEREKNSLVATAPLSRYTLYQGTWIPCTLMWALNSDSPGDVGCQVSQDIYDTVTGRTVLIPMYSKIYGPYNSDVANGQERMLIAFQRLIYPSGASVDLGAMSGADSTGRAGLDANVNNHFFKIFGSSFLIAGIASKLASNTPNQSNNITINTGSSTSSLSGAAGQVLVDTVHKILDRNTSIKPTLDNEAGKKLLVFVNRDLILPPEITLAK